MWDLSSPTRDESHVRCIGGPTKEVLSNFTLCLCSKLTWPLKKWWFYHALKVPSWCWSWNSDTLATWCRELTRLKRPWCWQRLRAGGEGDNRGWAGWMASLTQWTWAWVDSGDGDGQGGLAYCGSWGCKESDMTEWLNWTKIPSRPQVYFTQDFLHHQTLPCLQSLTRLCYVLTLNHSFLWFSS